MIESTAQKTVKMLVLLAVTLRYESCLKRSNKDGKKISERRIVVTNVYRLVIKEIERVMRRLIVAITGAHCCVVYGIRALEHLRQIEDVETHVIVTPSAYRTAMAEVDYTPEQIKALADHLYNHKDIGAAISSGSFRTSGMIVAPCSIKTLSAIANSFNAELIARSADVCMKERRPKSCADVARNTISCRAYSANGSSYAKRCHNHATRSRFLHPAANTGRCH